MFASIYLERQNFEKNEHRFYACDVTINLFNKFELNRRWGRIGGEEKKISEICQNLNSAIMSLLWLQYVKENRGYKPVNSFIPDSPVINMIPYRFYPYLSLKPAQLIEGDRSLHDLVRKLGTQGVIYVGDLVQLSEREVLKRICSANSQISNSGAGAPNSIHKLKTCLSKFGLNLNSSVPGWVRPKNHYQSLHHHPTMSLALKPTLTLLDA